VAKEVIGLKSQPVSRYSNCFVFYKILYFLFKINFFLFFKIFLIY